jgi:phenylpropionate dioxygenase-like ring-hydroxylating dioxygenase large terminal subunit
MARSSTRMDWRIGPAEPSARPIPPPHERPTSLIAAERYTSDEFARREFEAVFMHSWHLVGRDQDFPDVGDYLEFEVGDQSVLVVRVEEDLVKGYYNVCLHRGMQLRKGCGSAAELRCGYHSWCWNLDGSIKEVMDPYEYHPSLIAPEALHLREVRVETWGGFYFVNLDADAPSLLDHLGPVVETLAPYKLENMVYKSHRKVPLPTNWKTVVDNFGETYHIPTIHPQALPYADDVNEIVDNLGDHTIMKVPVMQPSARLVEQVDQLTQLEAMLDVLVDFELIDAGEQEILETLRRAFPEDAGTDAVKKSLLEYRRAKAVTLGVPDLTDEQLLDDWDVHIFPNIEVNILFDQLFGYVVHPNPDHADSCVFEIISLTQPKPGQPLPDYELETIDDYRSYPWNGVLAQDLSVFASMQKGLHSRGFPGMRFASYRERGLRHTHEMIDRWLEKYEQ